ncbi:MAG TPA: hypothetical protein VM186_03865 [Planctomycetota bacterium]|nr:hypothetical protein [Planctomycetota bacterium]
MNAVRTVLLAALLVPAFTMAAQAQEGTKGRALIQMIDAIYGDFAKCTEVPKAAIAKERETKLLVPVSGFLKPSYDSDKSKIVGRFSREPGQTVMLQTAFGTCYLVLSLLISIALSSVFLWLGANIAGQKNPAGFRTALIASSFDRVTIAALAIGVTFGMGYLLKGKPIEGSIGTVVIPVVLLILFFFVSTAVVKLVYRINWGKALLIQLCTRIAVVLLAVFVLGFASAVSLAAQ